MRKTGGIAFLTLAFLAFLSVSAKDSLNTGINPVEVTLDGTDMRGGWFLLFGDTPDILETKAREIIFMSDIDTLKIELDEWQTFDFDIINRQGEKAPVRVKRQSDNIFEKPDPELLKRSPSGKLSRAQAQFDIKSLVYGLSEIHPDMFSVCSQEEFFTKINEASESLPDSVTTLELYRMLAPIVASLGDGHTNLGFPYNDLFNREMKQMPFSMEILSNSTAKCIASIDSIIPKDSEIISINGQPVETLIEEMLPYVAGEKKPSKISRINFSFPALYLMLHPTEQYDIVYLPENSKKPLEISLEGATYDEITKRSPRTKKTNNSEPYSFSIDKDNNVALMDFRKFSDPEKMKTFADSMFRTLASENIGNLIIDLRQNGGGYSYVGDILLKYLSPEPFTQMEKVLVRVTPLTRKLTGEKEADVMFEYHTINPEHFQQPLSKEEGHYDGNVYLLTSNNTFSSASSFAWTFKECGAGKIVGEETGGMNVSYGDIIYYTLPVSNLGCTISYKRFWQFRADENDIHGAIPDIHVPSDKALEKTLSLIRSKSTSKKKH